MSTFMLELVTSSPSANLGSELCTPWIPPELIVLILVELWQGAHTPQERSALLVKVALVNRTWLTLIAHITTLDVRSSNYKEMMAFLQLLPQPFPIRERCDLLTMERKRAANQSCRSLTCHVDGRRWQYGTPTAEGPVPLSLVFSDLCVVRRFPPNLRHISISHTNWPLNSIFVLLRATGFPLHVTHLSLDYSFTSAAIAARISHFNPDDALRWICMQRYNPSMGPRTHLPNLRHISLSGVPTSFAVLILDVCPNVETLELARLGRLSDLVPLPPAVRTLVLVHPGVALSKREVESWALPEALDAGLFSVSEKLPRIVVRSATPDPVSFMALKRNCERFNVDLLYERDDSHSPSCYSG